MSWVHSRLMPTACSFAHIVADLVDMGASKTPHMTASEQALVCRLHFEQGKTRSDISRLLERSLSSISDGDKQAILPQPLLRARSGTFI